MKNISYLMLAAALAGGSAFAQAPTAAAGADFVLASGSAQLSSVQKAASIGLRTFAARFAGEAGQRPNGFPLDVRDVGELRHATIGWGFQVYDVSRAAVMSGAGLEAAKPTGIWRYEVILHDRPVGLLTLAKTGNAWQLVSVGGAGLVNDIETVVAAQRVSADMQFRYVRVPQATADFIQIKRGGAPAQYAALNAARGSLKVQAGPTGTKNLLEGAALQTQLRQLLAPNASN